MNRNDRVKATAETNRYEAKVAIKEYIKDVFNYVGGEYTDTMGGIIADHVLLEIPSSMTFNQVEEAFRRGMRDSDITRRPSPKNFCDFIRQREKQGLNVQQDYDEYAGAPVSSGNPLLDDKRNIMAMWASKKFWNTDDTLLGSNWESDYLFLTQRGLITEPKGWLKEWRERAVNYIIGSDSAKSVGSIREVIAGRRMREELSQDKKTIMATVYRLRVLAAINSWLDTSLDGFNRWFNEVTPDIPAAYVMPTNDVYKFEIK